MYSPFIYTTDEARMKKYFQLAKNSSLFAEYYQNISIHDFQQAPVLDKKQLIPILEKNFHIHEETTGIYLVRSGGSTQKPLIFPVDIHENHHQRKVLAEALVKENIFGPKTMALNLFGYTDMYRTAAIMDDILERCQATTLPMSAHAAYDDIYAIAKHFKPGFLLGTPSKLLLFAQYLQKNGHTLSIPGLLFAGEFLRPSLQAFLKNTFHTEHIYSLYGSAETGIWAWSAYSKTPSLFRVIDGIAAEIMEPDAEGYGQIVVTNFHRERFPVFRYAIGDVGRWVQYQGQNYLELKTREKKSFILLETHYHLDDLQTITAGADAFQLQLSTDPSMREEISLLMVKDIPETEQADFISEKTTALQQWIDYQPAWMDISVSLVPMQELYTDRTTSKTPLLVDRRK